MLRRAIDALLWKKKQKDAVMMRARGGVPSRPRVHPRKQRQPFPPRDRFDNDTNWETHTPPVVFRAFLCVVVCVALRRGATPFTKLQDGHTKKEKKTSARRTPST